MQRILVLPIALAACGAPADRPDAVIVVQPDAAVDSPPPINVELDTFNEPVWIAYRDGAGSWTVPEETGPGQFNLVVTSDFIAVVVCKGTAGSFVTSVVENTTTDASPINMFCPDPSTPSTFAVSGQMTQAGRVSIGGGAQMSSTAPWPFTIDATAGLHELVATGPSSIAIRRNQNITANATLPTIDLTTEGKPLTAIPVALTGVKADETIFSETYLLTANDFAMISEVPGSTLQVAPASLLAAHDFQLESIQANTATEVRYIDGSFPGAATLALMPRLADIAFATDASVTWGQLPTYDELELDIMSPAGSKERVVASSTWIAATHTTRLAFDPSMPGYSAAWGVDVTSPYLSSFGASAGDQTAEYGTMVFSSPSARVNRPHKLTRATMLRRGH